MNRCAGDWITLHLFYTLVWLVKRHQSAFSFLKNGGMKWAEKVRHLTPETLASSARLTTGGGGIKAILANKHVPQLVREALNAMQMASLMCSAQMVTGACVATTALRTCSSSCRP